MKRNILFHIKAFEDYLYWQSTDDEISKIKFARKSIKYYYTYHERKKDN